MVGRITCVFLNMSMFKCGYCKREFRSRGALGSHRRTHRMRPPWYPHSCGSCRRRFPRAIDYHHHKCVKGPYTCGACRNLFPNMHQLRDHPCAAFDSRPVSSAQDIEASSVMSISNLVHPADPVVHFDGEPVRPEPRVAPMPHKARRTGPKDPPPGAVRRGLKPCLFCGRVDAHHLHNCTGYTARAKSAKPSSMQ